MTRVQSLTRWRAASQAAALMMFLFSFLAVGHVQAAPLAAPVVTELIATQDARIQAGSPDVGFGGGLIWVGTPNGHLEHEAGQYLRRPHPAGGRHGRRHRLGCHAARGPVA
jgi:hypothetical protein